VGPVQGSLRWIESEPFDGSEALDQDPVLRSVGQDGVDRSALDVRVEYGLRGRVEGKPDRVLQKLGRRDGRQRRVRVLESI
jgi:hypothetical protein